MSSMSYYRFMDKKKPQRTDRAQKRLKLEPLSPMECVGSSWSQVLKRDIDDASRDSGIGCDFVLSSPNQFSSPAMKLTPARRLDFSDILSPTDTIADVATKPSPSSRFTGVYQPSPTSPQFNRNKTRRHPSRRPLFQRSDNPNCGSTISSPGIVDVSPVSTDVHRQADCTRRGASAMMMVCDNVDENPLIGDFSRPCSLPVVHGKHADLQSISPETLARVLCNEAEHVTNKQVLVIDCRYPYEYDAGHIRGAINIYTKSSLRSLMLENVSLNGATAQRSTIVVFHCEFSSKRGPSLARFLRQCDRANHADSYPSLSYPELYLLEGGYKAFYERHSRLCSPREYLPMLQRGYEQALCQFRAECKRDSRLVRQSTRRPLTSRATDHGRPCPLRL